MSATCKLDTSAALHEVKPLCVRLLKDRSKDNVTVLRRALEQLNDEACQELHEYLLLPLALVLKNENKSDALLIETIQSIRFVLDKVCVNNERLFSDIFLNLLFIVSTVKESLQVSSTSEELKLAFCNCLRSLVNSALPCVLLQAFDGDFRLCLSHAVTILLLLSEKERNRKLQIASMECLSALACQTINDIFKSTTLYEKVGNAFAGFFPGISIALTRVILDAENRSQKTIVAALRTWAWIIHVVLGDTYLECLSSTPELDKQSPSSKVPIVHRNDDWVRSTGERLAILVDKVLPSLTKGEEPSKLAALEWARVLLLQCSRSLETLTPSVLQMVLSLSADDSEKVSTQSRSLLDEVANHMLVLDSLSLIEILEEDFHRTLSKCPRILRTGSESEKLTLVKLLSGYLRIFRDKVAKILMSPAVSQRLLGVLFLLTEFETSNTNLLSEQASPLDYSFAADPAVSFYNNQFKHFTDMNIFREFTIICALLGTYGDVVMLVDILRHKIQESATCRKQAILVLGKILRSRGVDRDSGRLEPEQSDLVRSLLEYFVSKSLWDLPLSGSEEFGDTVSATQQPSLQFLPLDKINSNILQSCLLLEGVAVLAQLLKEKFRPLLRLAICPLLEKADSPNHLVSHAACLSLSQVSNACGYSSISELIQQNADYIANTVLFKLRHPSSHSNVARIVQALARHSDKETEGLLEDIGHEVLSALDFCHKDNALPFLRVLASIVVYLNTWFPAAPKKDAPEDDGPTKEKEERTFVQFVEEFHRCKRLSVDFEIPDEELESSDVAENDDACSMETDEKPPVPGHVKLLVQILRRCIHLQSSSDIFIQTVVLTIISHAVVPLSCCEDELLPVVHLLWKPLVARFQKDDCNLCIKAFEALMALAETAKEFIRQRTLQDVWPRLGAFLQNQHTISKNKGKAYEITAAFKYQLLLLQNLGRLSCQLKVQEQDIALLTSSVVPYLEHSQPPRLQEAAVSCVQDLARCSADTVWYFVASAHCTSQSPWSPAAPLQALPFGMHVTSENQNASLIMLYLSSMDKPRH